MTPRERLAWLERRGRALRLFVDRVAERGDVAEVELEDLFCLRIEWRMARAACRTTVPAGAR